MRSARHAGWEVGSQSDEEHRHRADRHRAGVVGTMPSRQESDLQSGAGGMEIGSTPSARSKGPSSSGSRPCSGWGEGMRSTLPRVVSRNAQPTVLAYRRLGRSRSHTWFRVTSLPGCGDTHRALSACAHRGPWLFRGIEHKLPTFLSVFRVASLHGGRGRGDRHHVPMWGQLRKLPRRVQGDPGC